MAGKGNSDVYWGTNSKGELTQVYPDKMQVTRLNEWANANPANYQRFKNSGGMDTWYNKNKKYPVSTTSDIAAGTVVGTAGLSKTGIDKSQNVDIQNSGNVEVADLNNKDLRLLMDLDTTHTTKIDGTYDLKSSYDAGRWDSIGDSGYFKNNNGIVDSAGNVMKPGADGNILIGGGSNTGGGAGNLFNFSGREAGDRFINANGELMEEGTFFDSKVGADGKTGWGGMDSAGWGTAVQGAGLLLNIAKFRDDKKTNALSRVAMRTNIDNARKNQTALDTYRAAYA